MMDIYDQAVEYLSERVEHGDADAILMAWAGPRQYTGGILFQFAGNHESNYEIGCLTQIRGCETRIAETPELTERIRADERLPSDVGSITVEMLPVFAEWQRKLDTELGRPTPEKI